jgi:hypothetical protein
MARMDAALEQACRVLPSGGDHESLKYVAEAQRGIRKRHAGRAQCLGRSPCSGVVETEVGLIESDAGGSAATIDEKAASARRPFSLDESRIELLIGRRLLDGRRHAGDRHQRAGNLIE